MFNWIVKIIISTSVFLGITSPAVSPTPIVDSVPTPTAIVSPRATPSPTPKQIIKSQTPIPSVIPTPMPTPTPFAADFCRNIPYIQTVLPMGMYRTIDGDCFYLPPATPIPTPALTPTPVPTPTLTPTPVPTPTPVQSVNLIVGKYTSYSNQSTSVPRSIFKIGHFYITTNDGLDRVDVNDIFITVNSSNTFTADKLSNVFIKFLTPSGQNSLPKLAQYQGGNLLRVYDLNLHFYSSNIQTYQLEVWADISAGINVGDSMDITLRAEGSDNAENPTTLIKSTEVIGQTITVIP